MMFLSMLGKPRFNSFRSYHGTLIISTPERDHSSNEVRGFTFLISFMIRN